MSYGMQLFTNQGLVDVANIEVASIVYTFSGTSTSGTHTVTAFDDSNGLGHISCITNDKKAPPQFSWNNSTKVLSWQAPNSNPNVPNIFQQSTSFRFVFWRFD